MVSCFWAPTSRHVITISEFHIRLTVWSMIDKSVQYIEGPKCLNNDHKIGLQFSPNNKMLAVIQKNMENSKDMIGLYDISASLDPSSNTQ